MMKPHDEDQEFANELGRLLELDLVRVDEDPHASLGYRIDLTGRGHDEVIYHSTTPLQTSAKKES
jgi:hypothetical protein